LARQAGLDCAGGVAVDLAARTSDPDIYAIGDCSIRPLPVYGCVGRLESVPNAVEQAKQAAAAICGRSPPAPEVPWFWSDQFDLRLQFAGLPFGAAAAVIRGDPATPGFAVFHLDAEGVVLAVEAVNAAPEFMAGRMMIAQRRKIARERLQDPSLSMREIAA
jgi:3-phenylpropionate/trans-cinnamate dioxygenase ferredoxin reductase subunit